MKKILFVASAILITEYSFAQSWSAGGGSLFTISNVGVGLSGPPVSQFQVTDGNVLFDGVIGTTPVSGGGTRMMWIPDKAAFRAGAVTGSQWDNANIGNHSFATGSSTTASGTNSFAAGQNTLANGLFAVATGTGTTAGGSFSFAAGNATNASGGGAVAFGFGSIASGTHTAAFGNSTTALSVNSFVIGRYNNNPGTSNPSFWVATDPLFMIGNGTSSSATSNAMTVLKNGHVGIGTDNPIERVRIETDANGLMVKTNHIADWGYNSVSVVNRNNTKAITVQNSTLTGGYAEPFKVLGSGQTEIINKLPTGNDAIGLWVGERSMFDAHSYNPLIAGCKMYVFQSSNSEYAAVFHNNGGSGKGVLIQAGSGTGSSAEYAALKIVTNGSSPGDPAYEIFKVNGKNRITYAREIIVNLTPVWPDYVFEPSYELRSLNDLENYFTTHKHLPEIPSASEVEADGINIAQMDALLLKKVEELTLYLIGLKKENESIKKEIELLKKTN